MDPSIAHLVTAGNNCCGLHLEREEEMKAEEDQSGDHERRKTGSIKERESESQKIIIIIIISQVNLRSVFDMVSLWTHTHTHTGVVADHSHYCRAE